MIDFTKKENSLDATNVFSNISPGFNITKSEGWEFSYSSEGMIGMDDKEDADGGEVRIYLSKFPFIIKNEEIKISLTPV